MNKPIYTRIANELRTNIEEAVYQSGDKLPTEKNLSERFNVNRHTIRNAIALLKDEGLIRVDRGRGMFVAKTPIKYPIGERVRYNESLEAQGIKASYEKLKAVEIPSDKAIADALKIDLGAPVVLIERVGLANDRPISIGSSYFPSELFPDLIKFWENYRSISKLLKEIYDRDHIRRSTTVCARIVREADARLLQIPANQPILLAQSINCDALRAGVANRDEKIVEYGVTRFSGEMMELVFRTIKN
ncbi:phosphonate metabolism transcriptional regulator PhnF [Waterburya agarophytonicola K14]|uniref:Phosphonate metabolism transcriptional regulator PhnF n=1 Tax=Waterburya agarophytonicola KI4 TaxID=2874699 RepID=A0A964BQQ6_9CYAN|nr:phosphonate metabolism transcriptional regulator PhnF [Waterburya agarophytonicola]MCC0177096.1 phosphonate metabolism transcriptional regulator PhnF [Waterburya agarophytonicola KI4]